MPIPFTLRQLLYSMGACSLMYPSHAYSGMTPRLTALLHWCQGCLICQAAETAAETKSCVMQELLELAPQVLNMPPTECEVLYGRCGYIYSLLFAQKYLGADAETSGLIKQLLQQVVVSGQRGAAELRTMSPDSKWSLTWSWHGSYYLGGKTSDVI